MRAVFGLVLLVGLALAGFAVYMAQGYFEQQQVALEQQRLAAAQQTPTVEVWAVVRPMAYGEPITREDVQPIRYAEPFLPEGVFFTEEELFPQGLEVLRVVLRPMETNEPVLMVKVTEPGENAGLTTLLGLGMRAFAIRVDVASGVSGFLRPGDKVDVYWTGRVQSASTGEQDVTRLIQGAVKLIAVDQTSDSNSNSASIARTVTVEATPEQVAALAQAQSTGSLSLSLVGANDDTIASGIEVNQRSLLGLAEQQVVEAAPEVIERVCTIRTRKGAEVVEIPIPCSD